MVTPRLSICIPTYNRRKYLGDTITSITTQVSAADASRIEICVSDNASTDGTEILIRELQSRTPVRIIYFRNETNLGADANYLRAVELASGDYCWFMGSDDFF
jgi:abequosyltransferase